MMKRTVILLLMGAMLFGWAQGVQGQSKAETTLYNKTLKKLSLKSAEKFLAKYPEGFYSDEITFLRDSIQFFALDTEDASSVLAFKQAHSGSRFSDRVEDIIRRHNTSPLSKEEALKLSPEGKDAVGYRRNNEDRLLLLDFSSERIALEVRDMSGELLQTRSIPVHTLDPENLSPSRLVDPMEIVSLGSGRNYVHFSYLNEGESDEKEYVEVLYDPDLDIPHNVMFYGKALAPKNGADFSIEGQSPERMEGVVPDAETVYLLSSISGKENLVQISKADLLTDESIKWWREKNPNAETNASRITFGALDVESSIVQMYVKSKKETGKLFNAALFDYRGWTIICAYSKSTQDYLLVWCEPQCKNKNRDKLLNSIYFENDSSLAMFYYKGRTTFKYRLNLANKSLRRQ